MLAAVDFPLQDAPVKRAKIVLVDDHPMVRERLAEVIERQPDLIVCGEAESKHQALQVIAATNPDLVIIDLTLKGSHGLDLIKDLHARYPRLQMLVVSMHDESLHAERAVRAGARGYITKQEATKRILQAIRAVLNGDIFLSEKTTTAIAGKIVGLRSADTPFTVDQLTDREFRVFELISKGLTMRQIAEELKLDIKTIETYRMRIKEKLCLKDANEVLQSAIRWSHTNNVG